MNQHRQHIGKVILAGAGPGDPELLTLKHFAHFSQPTWLITDRLVSETILEEYTPKNALVLHVGKQCRKGASTPQEVINELIVEYALQGKKVVRLKGGDVSFFSNILDELQALSAHQIPFEIIPGITAASGAAAYAGIPLTARGHALAVRFLTCYQKDILDESYWKDLARTDDTLVFYMSSDTTDEVVKRLVENGIGSDKHIAVWNRLPRLTNRFIIATFMNMRIPWGGSHYISPTLLIIGKCAALRTSLNGCRK